MPIVLGKQQPRQKKKKKKCLLIGCTVKSTDKFHTSDMYTYLLFHLFKIMFLTKIEFSVANKASYPIVSNRCVYYILGGM